MTSKSRLACKRKRPTTANDDCRPCRRGLLARSLIPEQVAALLRLSGRATLRALAGRAHIGKQHVGRLARELCNWGAAQHDGSEQLSRSTACRLVEVAQLSGAAAAECAHRRPDGENGSRSLKKARGVMQPLDELLSSAPNSIPILKEDYFLQNKVADPQERHEVGSLKHRIDRGEWRSIETLKEQLAELGKQGRAFRVYPHGTYQVPYSIMSSDMGPPPLALLPVNVNVDVMRDKEAAANAFAMHFDHAGIVFHDPGEAVFQVWGFSGMATLVDLHKVVPVGQEQVGSDKGYLFKDLSDDDKKDQDFIGYSIDAKGIYGELFHGVATASSEQVLIKREVLKGAPTDTRMHRLNLAFPRKDDPAALLAVGVELAELPDKTRGYYHYVVVRDTASGDKKHEDSKTRENPGSAARSKMLTYMQTSANWNKVEGRYQLVRKLGSGTFGDTYAALDLSANYDSCPQVAVKLSRQSWERAVRDLRNESGRYQALQILSLSVRNNDLFPKSYWYGEFTRTPRSADQEQKFVALKRKMTTVQEDIDKQRKVSQANPSANAKEKLEQARDRRKNMKMELGDEEFVALVLEMRDMSLHDFMKQKQLAIDGVVVDTPTELFNKKVEVAARAGQVVIDALQAAHCDGNLIHRDIKEANIIIDRDGTRPLVIDLGLSKAWGKKWSNETKVQETNAHSGTQDYVSVNMHYEMASQPSDDLETLFYSLVGMILNLTGQHGPLSAEQKEERLHKLKWKNEESWVEVCKLKQDFLQKLEFNAIPNEYQGYLKQLAAIVKPYSTICKSCRCAANNNQNKVDLFESGCNGNDAACRKGQFGKDPGYDAFKRVLGNLANAAASGRIALPEDYCPNRWTRWLRG